MKPGLIIPITFFALILAACAPSPEPTPQSTSVLEMDTPTVVSSETPYPDPPTSPPETPLPATPYPEPAVETSKPSLWIADYVPEGIVTQILAQLGEDISITTDKQNATLVLDLNDGISSIGWVYALVAPFPTILDEIATDALSVAWEGRLTTYGFSGVPLLMDNETYGVFSTLWGTPASGAVKVIPTDELLQTAWENQPSWAIIPFEQLEPRWKVLAILDTLPTSQTGSGLGISPIQKGFDLASYPLMVGFGLSGATIQIDPISNYDPNKMTDIMLTGVTALVRGTALTMERKGITYPGEDIAPLTTAVDFMHVNNEIPFTPDCLFPELYPEKLVFCSDVRYLDLIEYIGTDLVEVSGDHFGDHGSQGTLFTLDLYDELGLPYYGGGRDLADGRQPYLIEHNGNKIAILGCNAKGSDYYAPADDDTPGAVPCNFDWMEGEIAHWRTQGYQVIVTLQHIEYYSYVAQPDLVRDFGRMAAAGASIVSGSQSHQAHGMAFADGAFIHYGLGNLFFDQYLFCEEAACDYGFMDRHIIYNGRHISTELIPIRFIDMARPRLMTADEKNWFLDWIFEASGWE